MERFNVRIFPLLLFLIVTGVYLYTMNPTVTVGDSGEFIAAAKTLSLPHSPSYPLFTLLGKASSNLFPFADSGYRVNLVSLLSGSLSAVLLFFVGLALNLSPLASFFTAIIFSSSRVLWEYSLSSEVFTLNCLFAMILLYIWTADDESKNRNSSIALSSLILGLGLGNHHTLVLIVPGILLLYYLGGAPKNYLKDFYAATLFFTIGFFVYAFLPIRSLKNPPLDWSNPENLQNFIRVITRADYGSLSLTLGEKLPRNFETAFQQCVRYAADIVDSFSWLGLLAGFAGWFAWSKRESRTFAGFLAVFLISGIGFLLLGNLPFDAQSNGILPRFFMLPMIPFCLALGQFFEWSRKLTKFWILFPAFILVYSAASSFSVVRHFRHDYVNYDYGRNMFKSMPPKSILFMDGGDDTFYTMTYHTMAERRRPDLEIHDRGGLIFKNPYGDDFRRLIKSEKEKRRQLIESSFLSVRPLFYATFDKKILPEAKLEQQGILYRAVPSNMSPQNGTPASPWNFYALRGIYENIERPYRLRALVPLYPFLEGLDRWNLKYFRRTAACGKDILWIKSNLPWELSMKGYEFSNAGKKKESEELFQMILEIDPRYASAYSNLGVLASDRNDFDASEKYYKEALKIDPKNPDAHFNLGVLYWKQSRWRDVVECFRNTLKYKPDHPTAQQYLMMAEVKLKGSLPK